LRMRLNVGVSHGSALDRDARVGGDALTDGCVDKPTAEVGEGVDAVLGSCHVLLHQRILDVAQEEAQLRLAGYAVYVTAASASTGLDDARPRPPRVPSQVRRQLRLRRRNARSPEESVRFVLVEARLDRVGM